MNFDKLLFWKKPIIEFFCHPQYEDIIPKPTAAGKVIPDWYKKLPSHYTSLEHDPNNPNTPFELSVMTAKKCLPLLDAMSTGFVIPLSSDVHINSNHDNSQIVARENLIIQSCEFHNSNQIGGHNAIKKNNGHPLKFLNRWIIKTAPGWSTLFIPPLNHFEQPFTCLAGLVDTDKYPKEVNFPAVLNVTNFKGKIAAGTPLVIAIPIKRNPAANKLHIRKINVNDLKLIEKMQNSIASRENYYTNELRVKK